MHEITGKVDALHLRIDTAAARARDEDRKRYELVRLSEQVLTQMAQREADYSSLSEVSQLVVTLRAEQLTWPEYKFSYSFIYMLNTLSLARAIQSSHTRPHPSFGSLD